MKVHQLLRDYGQALSEGATLSSPQGRSLYAIHQAEFARLVALVDPGAPIAEIAQLVAGEERGFGWSYLSEAHGERGESAFHALALSFRPERPANVAS